MLDCVCFDLDGLLVDSEPLQFRSYRYAFARFGVTLDLERWIRWHSVEASVARWVKEDNLDVDPEAVRALKKNHYDELITGELQLKPGAGELVAECADNFKLAVVSGSRRESIEDCLQKFGLRQYFSTLVSGTEQRRSKPYPDAYIEAMRAMQTTPGAAIAVEDSMAGYLAARAAGLGCIICPDGFIPKARDAFAGAVLIVESLCDLDSEIIRSVHTP